MDLPVPHHNGENKRGRRTATPPLRSPIFEAMNGPFVIFTQGEVVNIIPVQLA